MTPARLSPAQLLEIEDTSEVLSHVCPRTGVPLWSMIRWEVLDGLLQWTWTDGDPGPGASGVGPGHRVAHLLKGAGRNTAIVARGATASMLVVGNTAARTLIKEGKAFNPLTDYLVEFAGSSCAMEVPDPDNAGRGRHGVLDQYPMRVAARLAGRVRHRETMDAAQALVEWIRRRTSSLLGLDVPSTFLERWARHAAGSAASLPTFEAMWSVLLRRLDVKVVIKIDGSYGGPENVSLLRAARRLSVVVAEHQHGVVNRAHMAYNYAPTLVRSAAYADTLPPVILTYGSWWHSAFNVPARLVPLGNPHRQAMSPGLATSQTPRQELVVLGNAVDTEASLAFCGDLSDRVHDGITVTFRPHPGERRQAKDLARAAGLERVHLDLSDDLYRALGRARAVAAEASTGLYEAVGLVPQIFVWGNPKGLAFSADAPFDVVADARELASALEEPRRGAPPAGLDDAMWAPDWQRRLAAFAGECGVRLD